MNWFGGLFRLLFVVNLTFLRPAAGFNQNDFSPTRSGLTDANDVEKAVCREITDRISWASPRFNSELVQSANSLVYFCSSTHCQWVSSRLKTRLDALANAYPYKMTITLAWVSYPYGGLESNSLHYEGRSIRVQLGSNVGISAFLQKALEVGFDWVYWQSSNVVRLSVLPSNCDRVVDGIFLLDSSGSVGSSNFQLFRDFMKNVASYFNIGPDASQFAAATFDSYSRIEFNLNTYSTLSSLRSGIDGINYPGGGTLIVPALNLAKSRLNPSNNYGARPASKGVPKITIVMTDGHFGDYSSDLTTRSAELRNQGVVVYAIGVAGANVNQLNRVASDPDSDHVFFLSSFSDISGFVDTMSAVTCSAPAIIEPGDNTTTGVDNGNTKYFQTVCNTFSTKVIVDLLDITGTSHLYVSSIVTNPGPLTPNTQRNETANTNRRHAEVTLQSNKVVYIGVQGQTQMATFTIIVWDNLFSPADVYQNLLEGQYPGRTVIRASDTLVPGARGNQYTYSFIEGSGGEGIFSIDSTGHVIYSINGPGVSYSRKRHHNLIVQAQNVHQPCQRARIRILITVFRNSILFNNIGTLSISENANTGLYVTQVVGTGGTGSIVYSLVAPNSYFSLDSANGVIRLIRTLNYEVQASHTLSVRAQSTGDIVVSSTKTVNIQVIDENEPKVFTTSCARTSSGCIYSINENSPPALLGQISVSDPDLSSQPTGQNLYTISPNGVPFSVDSVGNIRSTASLDRETAPSYIFNLNVADTCASHCRMTITTRITVNVLDLNDNKPIFSSNPSVLQIREDQSQNSIIAQYSAYDRDAGANAVIAFSLSPSGTPFSLTGGTLRLVGSIDFEITESYSITITASNPGSSQSTSTSTTIQILNINDNRPIFTGTPYSVMLKENRPSGTSVIDVSATDADKGLPGQLEYLITSGNTLSSFQINSQTGLITTTKIIDRETTSGFQLTVVARDSGSPRMLSTTIVSVTIIDENDNSPIFNPTSYPVSVREDLPVNQNVIQVVATDADQPMTSNSNIVYSIISGNTGNAFRIESNGQIKVNQMLDYETTPSYNLRIQARDSGTTQRSNTATVTVTVVNVNENPPTLSGDQSVSISESAPRGSTVAIFQAQDQDQMAVVITITAGNSEGKFSIGSSTGVITLASQLNYEVTTLYSLTITASDGAQTTSSTLTVTVEDANEFTPSFTAPFSFTIQEQRPANSVVGTVSATDGDRGAVVTYRFVTNDQTTSKFSLDSRTGEITTASVLDREVLEQIFTPPTSMVTVRISATDNGSPSRLAIKDYTITLTDINDNPPTFSSASYSAQLRENLASGQTVFILDATDPDLGSNARISYSFTLINNQGLPNPFQLNTASNSIVTSQELDYEVKSFYDFSIRATDAGNPPRTSTVSGRLNVIDENDNSPVFTNSTYILYVGEDVLPGNTILTVQATDADSGTNGEVEYYITGQRVYTPIEGGYSETLFQIGRSSGDLSILNSFDFERSSVESLNIYANDKGSPQRTASASVMIFVRNVDEDPPYFPLSSSCDATVQEDISIGSFVSNCTAIDPDSVMGGIQSSVTYSVISSQFTISRTTGEITSIATLDREQSNSYRIPVVATDSSGKTVTRETTITVTDVNDNAPAFSSSSYSYRFTDQNIRDHVVQFIQIQATDADFGDNGRVSFYIGSVNTTETQSIVEVIGGDNGSPQLNSSVFVTVTYDSPCLIQVYSIDSSSGAMEARLMCSVAVIPSPTVNLILGKAGSISCKVVSNLVTEYRWLQNGATVMRPGVLERGNQEATLSFAAVANSHAGDYSCKATSEVGSVQSSASKAAILVPPVIVSPPTDIAIRQGTTATFTCSAVGDPPPTVEWFRGTRRLSRGTTLSLPSVTSAEAGLYTCGVTSSAGTSTASARLIIFDKYNVVRLELTNINNPKSDGSCQFFNPSDIASTINSATGQRVLVADLSGSNICENSACSPNPCKNRGECTVNDQAVGGFMCSCKRGFTGTTCNTDVDECTQSPCGINGNCVNTKGSFDCNCFANRTGRVCEYEDLCSSMPCNSSAGECLESTSLGYVCAPVQKDVSVVVGTPKMSLFRLNELVQDFVYAQQRLALTRPSSNRTARRKRQASSSPPLLNTLCSPRFVVSGGDTVLLWACPPGEPQPTPDQQQMLCQYLFDEGAVSQCTSPQGQLMTAPTTATVAPTSVVVEVVLLDQSNQPVDSKDSIKTIESSSAGSELSKQGVTLAAVQPETTEERPDTNKSSNLPIIIGAAVGAVAGIAILIIIIILVYVFVAKKKRSYQEMKDKKKARAMQMIQREEKKPAESDTRNLIVNTSAEIDTSA